MRELDVRGFDCPIPVVKTKKAMDERPDEQIRVFADSAVAKENVTRLAESRGYNVESERSGADEFRLLLTPLGK
jgi:tRNA 2-thiouridine synthesizing protein A